MAKLRPSYRPMAPEQLPAAQPEAQYKRALNAFQHGRALEAESMCQQIIAEYPQAFDAVHLLGVLAYQSGHYVAAAALLARARSLDPENPHAHTNLGLVHHATGQYQAALACFDQAIRCAPDFAKAYSNRSLTHYALKQFQAAVDDCGQAIRLAPDFAEAYNNRGHALISLYRHTEAIADLTAALAIRPNYASAHYNLGVAYQEQLDTHRALASYHRALELNPNHAEAYWNVALLSLLMGDYASGWELHEWRFRQPSYLRKQRHFTAPVWLGQAPLAGKTILLHAEQGLGDTLQFCRYAPLVASLGARVILEVQAPLVNLLRSLPGDIHVVEIGSELAPYDFHCPLLSLPLAFKTTLENIPLTQGYLYADPEKAARWEERLATFGSQPRIGLVWSGGFRADQPEVWNVNERRNLPLARIAELNMPDFLFVSLQKGEPAESELRDRKQTVWPSNNLFNPVDALADFSDTAALIARLDLVISVDTSTAHLAAAMGKPVWLLNRFDTCWRWLEKRSDSPWYDSVQQFRQTEFANWDSVLEAVKNELHKLAIGLKPSSEAVF